MRRRPNYHTPKPDTPPRFVASSSATSSQAPADEHDLATWWRALNDPELDSLVDRALKANLDLEIALTRLQQARTYETVVMGYALPEVNASAAAGRGTGSDLGRGRADQALVSATNTAGSNRSIRSRVSTRCGSSICSASSAGKSKRRNTTLRRRPRHATV